MLVQNGGNYLGAAVGSTAEEQEVLLKPDEKLSCCPFVPRTLSQSDRKLSARTVGNEL